MRPKQPPTFDPNEPRYWDPRDLEQELERVFTVCHSCRMCISYCPSFPDLFRRVDGYVERGKGEIDAFDAEDYKAVNDLCYQCKICYFKCPYTPEDDHPFQLDFPRVMLRYKAHRARRDGVTLQDKVLGEPQLLGQLAAGPQARMTNLVSKNRLLRKVQAQATGISAEFNLPPFAGRTLRKWFDSHKPRIEAGTEGEVALFATCTATYNVPAAGVATVQVLEHNGLTVHFPEGQTCCGMPNLDGGDIEGAVRKAKQNIGVLYEHVQKGRKIVVPGPTCSYVLRKEYPQLVGTQEAKAVANSTFDSMEMLRARMRDGKLRGDFVEGIGRVGYHAPCHLRAQKIGTPGRQVLEAVPGTEVEVVEQCSAVDGTWGMKEQYFELGRQYARKLVQGLSRGGSFDAVCTDCPLAALRIEQELGRTAAHPMELLNRAYGLPAAKEQT